jgi:hypothetical protein
MSPKLSAVMAVALVACLVGSSDAISCYDCSSVLSSGCSDPFSSSGLTPLTGCTTCMKVSTSLYNVNTVTRTCGGAGSSGCTTTSGVTTCYCSTDNCNSADSLAYSRLAFALMAFAAIAAFLRR